MSDVKKAKISRFTAIIISLAITLVLSAVATIIAGNLIKHDSAIIKTLATVFTGVATACFVMGLACIVIGSVFDHKLDMAIAMFLLFFALILILVIASLFGAEWWVILVVVLCSIPMPILAITFIYRKNLVLVTDDQKPDYKDWKTREKEKAENPEQKKEEELPEIKSFK